MGSEDKGSGEANLQGFLAFAVPKSKVRAQQFSDFDDHDQDEEEQDPPDPKKMPPALQDSLGKLMKLIQENDEGERQAAAVVDLVKDEAQTTSAKAGEEAKEEAKVEVKVESTPAKASSAKGRAKKSEEASSASRAKKSKGVYETWTESEEDQEETQLVAVPKVTDLRLVSPLMPQEAPVDWDAVQRDRAMGKLPEPSVDFNAFPPMTQKVRQQFVPGGALAELPSGMERIDWESLGLEIKPGSDRVRCQVCCNTELIGETKLMNHVVATKEAKKHFQHLELTALAWQRMQRDGWQLPYHSCFFSKMKYSCRLCGVGGAWWELFTHGEEGHIHTKKHLSKMAGACRPSLNRDSEEHEQRPWDDLLFDYTQGRQTSMKKALLTAASWPIATANADVTAAAVMVAEAVKKAAASTAAVAATPPTELASPVTTMALVPARPLAQQMAVVPARQVAVVPARPLAQQVAVVPARRVLLRSRSRPRSRQRRSRTRSRSRRRSPSTSSTPRRRRKRRQRRQRRKSTTSSSSSTSSRCSRRQQHQQRTRRRRRSFLSL